MAAITFYKLQASGNDFILVDNRKLKLKSLSLKKLAQERCQRKLGIGADGLLVIEPSKKACFKMRIFNADGSEAEMCGNGARCTAYWAKLQCPKSKTINFETKAGIIEAVPEAKNIKIKLSNPKNIKLHLPINVLGRKIHLSFINTGVPHVVIFVEGLEKIDVEKIGQAIRFHKKFQPQGTNVNFVELISDYFIKVRTYERGVEAETLACGTGAVASAVLTAYRLKASTESAQRRIRVKTKGGEVLEVSFVRLGDKLRGVWLSGRVDLVYKGEFES